MIKKINMLAMRLLLLISSAAAGADELSNIPLSKLYSNYAKYLTLPDGDRQWLIPHYELLAKQADPADVTLWFEYKNKKHEIPVDTDGFLTFFPTAAMLDTDPVVYVDQPRGSMGIKITLGFQMGDSLQFDMKQLHKNVHRAFKAAKSLGGLMSFFAPSHAGLHLNFGFDCPEPKAGYEHNGKVKTLMQQGDPVAVVPFKKDKKMRKGGKLVLSCPVKRAMLN